MIDLNSTLFFKGKFQIKAKSADNDLLWLLVQKIRTWMVPKWKRNGEAIPNETSSWSSWKHGGSITSEERMVHLQSVYHERDDGMHFWACKIIESWPSQNGCAPREWTTEIGFEQQAANLATISIVIYYNDRPGFIGPCEKPPEPSIPKIIKLFIKDDSIECIVERYPLDLKARLLNPGDFPDFWKIVCDENREIPVIYISPRKMSEAEGDVQNLVDPDRLMSLLGPNALIYYANDIEFSHEMTQLCSPAGLGCYSGSIRIYASHPHIQNPNDPYRHRYIGARMITELGDEIYYILRRALAQDVHFYDKMFRTEDCKRLNDLAAAEKRKKAYRDYVENELLGTAVEKEEALRQQLEAIDAERFQWECEVEKYTAQINELKADVRQCRAKEDAFRDAVALSNERAAALTKVREIKKYPENAEEVGEFFLSHFPDRIAFTQRGLNSLKDCPTKLDILWDALYQICTCLYDLYENDAVASVEQEFNQRSKFRLARGEGTMTRKDPVLMRQYTDEYQGKTIDIQAHIKSSESSPTSNKLLRIYFYYDSSLHKIIIGSCGRHLDNYTTQKIK